MNEENFNVEQQLWQEVDREEHVSPNGTGPVTPDEDYHLTDTGNAHRFIDLHGTNLRYCDLWGKWLVWDQARFAIDQTQHIRVLAEQTIKQMYHDAIDEEDRGLHKKMLDHALRTESARARAAFLSLAQPLVPIEPHQLDTDLMLLNVANGTLDLSTGRLKPHDQTDLITKLVPIVYDPMARCELWEEFLSQIFLGNEELIDWLQKVVGYTLTGHTQEHCFFLCYGIGRNGKSTFLTLLKQLLGDYAENVPFESFLHSDNDKVRNDLAKLHTCRLASALESDEARRLSEGLIKSLTGGDPITARFLRQEFFTYTPKFKVWLVSNHKPEIRGTDLAIWSRVKLIPFLASFTGERDDKQMGEKLTAELPGILAWAVRGCLRWQEEGLRPEPEAVRSATARYREEQDTLGQFLEECCLQLAQQTVPSTQLYLAYKAWTEANNERWVSQTKFASKLKERGFVNTQNTITSRMQWEGLVLKSPDIST